MLPIVIVAALGLALVVRWWAVPLVTAGWFEDQIELTFESQPSTRNFFVVSAPTCPPDEPNTPRWMADAPAQSGGHTTVGEVTPSASTQSASPAYPK